MSLLIAEGFDAGFTPSFDIGGGIIQDAPVGRTGKVVSLYYNKSFYPGGFNTTSYLIIHFNTMFVSGIPRNILVSVLNSSGVKLNLGINSSDQFYLSTTSGILGTGTTTLVANIWYNVQLKLAIKNSISAGEGKVQLDGSSEIDLAAGTDTCYSGNQDIVAIIFNNLSASYSFLLDDLIICDSSGSTNNDLYADTLRVGILTPNAAGDSTQGTVTGADSNYEAMDDTESSYVTLDGTDKDLYNLSAPVTIENCKGVVLQLSCRNGTATPIVKTQSTEYDQSVVRGDVDFIYNSIVLETNPNTSAAWSSSDLSALQIGAKL